MSERAVASTETDRLVKLIRLIFSSDKPGEIVGAVMAAKRVLDNNDRDGHWLAERFALGAAPVAVTTDDTSSARDDKSAIWFAWHRRHRLSPKEFHFVETIVAQAAPLSVKQRRRLNDIVARLEAS
jgi:hypothetical protein